MTSITDSIQITSAALTSPETPADVVRAVNEARAKDLRVAVVSTGHGMLALGDLSDSLVVDVSDLDRIEVDQAHRTARVGGGVTWRRLIEETTRVGLTAPFGTSTSVGVTGYSLGGGIGPLARFLGLGSSAVRAVEMVTAEGEELRVDGLSDPELLWGLKGGGGGFGVVTAVEIDLTPMPDMTGGLLVWPISRAVEVAECWSEWTRHAAGRMTTSLRMVQHQPGEGLVMIMVASPEPEIEVVGQLEDLLAMGPVANTVGTTDPATFISENGDPDGGPPVWVEHTLIDHLPKVAIEAAFEFADPSKGSPLLMTEFRHLGGALARPDLRGGALSQIDGNFSFLAMCLPEARSQVSHAVDVLSDFGRGKSYLNFGLESQDRKNAFHPETCRRLVALYDRMDPDRRMKQPHPA